MNNKYFDYLLENIHKADMVNNSRHAACLVHKGEIIATGYNRRKSHPLMKEYSGSDTKIFLHAELDALIRGLRRVGEPVIGSTDMYVARLSKGNNVLLSKPCPICSKAIEAFGINNVYHT